MSKTISAMGSVNILKQENKDLQQRLAIKDLEIVRLREAMSESLQELEHNNDGEVTYVSMNLRQALLSTPTTQADLDAYVKEQYGEPVAWQHRTYKNLTSNVRWSDDCIPLYALRKAE